MGPSPVAERTRCVEFTQTQDPLTALGVSCAMDLGPGQMLVDRCSQHTPVTRWVLIGALLMIRTNKAAKGWICRDHLRAHAHLSRLADEALLGNPALSSLRGLGFLDPVT